MKNVQKIEREHIDQLNRYLTDDLGNFGILITRHPLKKAEFTRTIDLWSGQRKAIITVTDADIEQMVEVFESKQRHPLVGQLAIEYPLTIEAPEPAKRRKRARSRRRRRLPFHTKGVGCLFQPATVCSNQSMIC